MQYSKKVLKYSAYFSTRFVFELSCEDLKECAGSLLQENASFIVRSHLSISNYDDSIRSRFQSSNIIRYCFIQRETISSFNRTLSKSTTLTPQFSTSS